MKCCVWLAVFVFAGTPVLAWGQNESSSSGPVVSRQEPESGQDNFARIKVSAEQQAYIQKEYQQMLGKLKEQGVVDPIRKAAEVVRQRPAISSGVRQVRFEEPTLVPRVMAPTPAVNDRPRPSANPENSEFPPRLQVNRQPVHWNDARLREARSTAQRPNEIVLPELRPPETALPYAEVPPSARPLASATRVAQQAASPFSQPTAYGQLPPNHWRQDPFADPVPQRQDPPKNESKQPSPAQNPFADPPQEKRTDEPKSVANPFADPEPENAPPANPQPQTLPPIVQPQQRTQQPLPQVQPPRLPQIESPNRGLPPIVSMQTTGTGCGTDAGCGTDSGSWLNRSQPIASGCGVDPGCGANGGSVGTGAIGFPRATLFGKRESFTDSECSDCAIDGKPICKPSLYYSIFGGIAQVDPFISDTSTSVLAGSYYFEDAFAIGVAAGQVLTSHLRTEVEFSYRSHDLYQFDVVTPSNTVALNASGETQVYSGMANIYWEFVNFPMRNIKPYLGAGLGFARFESDFQVGTTSLLAPTYDSDSALAYQWMAGVNWCTAPNMSLFVEYRYFAADGIRLESDFGSSIPGLFNAGLFDYRSDNIFAGLRFRF